MDIVDYKLSEIDIQRVKDAICKSPPSYGNLNNWAPPVPSPAREHVYIVLNDRDDIVSAHKTEAGADAFAKGSRWWFVRRFPLEK